MSTKKSSKKYIWAALALLALGTAVSALREIPELGMAASYPRVIAMILGYVGAGFYLAKSGILGEQNHG